MEFVRTAIPDVVICRPRIFGDCRGYFFETFRQDKLEKFIGHSLSFCQDNESKSIHGVMRGLHYQKMPYTQSKLVRVIEGCVLDVAVDLRIGSSTFGKHIAIELSGDRKDQLFVPRGFAHGFLVLSEIAVFAYKCDNYYAPDYDRGILFSDRDLKINWGMLEDRMLISEKDRKQTTFAQADLFDYSKNLYL